MGSDHLNILTVETVALSCTSTTEFREPGNGGLSSSFKVVHSYTT